LITALEDQQTEPANWAVLRTTGAEIDLINTPEFSGILYKVANHEKIAFDAERMTERRFKASERTEGNFGNAFQHACWNFMLVKKFVEIHNKIYGSDRLDEAREKAKQLTDAHENWRDGDEGNPCGDKAMDLSNNQIGRDLAHWKPTMPNKEAANILEGMPRQGLLTTNPH
jgi:hypothetical protein